MNHFNEKWFQEIAESARLPPISPEVINTLIPLVELQVRKIIQCAHKHQRRSKSKTLKVTDINLALKTNKLEPVYGLQILTSKNVLADDKPISGNVSVADFADVPLPPCPLLPTISLHWLAVKGVQPAISENPSFAENETDSLHLQLPKELQYLYARITGIILNTDNKKFLETLYNVLRTDSSMQELVPYLSRFFYMQIKANSKRLSLLQTIIKAIYSLHQNPLVTFESQLQQLLPAIFTCVVGAKLSIVFSEDHWSLRNVAAKLISELAQKYGPSFPDLHARICKTYMEAISQQSSVPTVFGGVVGLGCLGINVIKSVLLPQLFIVHATLDNKNNDISAVKAAIAAASQEAAGQGNEANAKGKKRKQEEISKLEEQLQELDIGVTMCREMVKLVLGQYIAASMQLPSVPVKRNDRTALRSTKIDLCDLEEALIPYYSIYSKELYYSRLML